MPIADLTMGDFLQSNWGYFAAALAAIGSFIVAASGALWWGVRQVGTWVGQKAGEVMQDHRSLVATLEDNIPKQTETLRVLTETMGETRDRGSDIVREIQNTKAAAAEISYGMEAMSENGPKSSDVARYMQRARQRLGIEKKPRDSDQ